MKKYSFLSLVLLVALFAGCSKKASSSIRWSVEKQPISIAMIKNNALIIDNEIGRPGWGGQFSEPRQIWVSLNLVRVEVAPGLGSTCVSFAGSYVPEHRYKSMKAESMTIHVLNEYDKQVWEQQLEAARHIYPEFEK